MTSYLKYAAAEQRRLPRLRNYSDEARAYEAYEVVYSLIRGRWLWARKGR